MLTTTGDNHGGNNNNDNNNSTVRSLSRPTDKDIIIGKGNTRRHRGNIWFLRYVLRHHKKKYNKCKTKKQKTVVLKRIVAKVRRDRRRFYDKDENGK